MNLFSYLLIKNTYLLTYVIKFKLNRIEYESILIKINE